MENEIIVIGAGAAGCMAAITAARAGRSVLVLEKNSIIGKKILATGNGRCNYTNEKMGDGFFRGEAPSFISKALSKFSVEDTIEFFKSIGIYPRSKDGYLYPLSREASSVRLALENELKRLGVKIVYECAVSDIVPNENGYTVLSDKGDFETEKVLLSPGGCAAPSSGSDGKLFEAVKKLGIKISEPAPALVPVKCKSKYLKKLSGVRAKAHARLYFAEGEKSREILAEDVGEVQFADYGLSGIVIFNLSRFISKNPGENFVIRLNFLPEFSENKLKEIIALRLAEAKEGVSLQKTFNGFLPAKLLEVMDERINGYYSAENIYGLFADFDFSCKGTLDFERAQVTAGGVLLTELTENFESEKLPGLFFAGEITDADGICGGYNLQWAWTSGYLAGMEL